MDNIVKMLVSLNEKNAAYVVLEALGKHASSLDEFNVMGKNFHSIKKYKEAYKFTLECMKKAEETKEPELILVAKKNLLQCLTSLNEGEEAIDLIDSTSKDYPEFYDTDTKIQKAFALFIVNRKDEGEQILKEIIADKNNTETDIDIAKFNMAAHDFRHGRFKDALSKFIHYGRKRSTNVRSSLPFSPWVGQLLNGIHNVILTAEAGIGDEFVNVRFMKHLKKYIGPSRQAYWCTDRKEVRDVFTENGIKCLSTKEALEMKKNNTLTCNSMEVPLHLNLQEKDLYSGPYIARPKALITPATAEVRVGLRWAGNPEYEHDLQRTIPIQQLFDKIYDPSIDFYSLQRDSDMEFLKRFDPKVINLYEAGGLDTIADTMRSISMLDVVITSCTSIAHMAASMGVETWVLPPIANYYVWSNPTNPIEPDLPYTHTQWYGENVKIFQQKKPKVWDDVFDDVASTLSRRYQLKH